MTLGLQEEAFVPDRDLNRVRDLQSTRGFGGGWGDLWDGEDQTELALGNRFPFIMTDHLVFFVGRLVDPGSDVSGEGKLTPVNGRRRRQSHMDPSTWGQIRSGEQEGGAHLGARFLDRSMFQSWGRERHKVDRLGLGLPFRKSIGASVISR